MCLASVSMLAIFAVAEGFLNVRWLIHEHRAPLYVVWFAAVCHAVLAMPPVLRTVGTVSLIVAVLIPGCVSRVIDDGAKPGMRVMSWLSDQVERTPTSTPIVIAGSRLYLILCEQDSRLLSRTVIVYVPRGETPERSPGRHLVPRDLIREQPPLEDENLARCIYVQMTGSQMIRCPLDGWNVRRWHSARDSLQAIGEVYLAELERKR